MSIVIRQILAATSFLTRIPVAPASPFSARELGEASRWFPLIGAALGLVSGIVAYVCGNVFPSLIVAILVVAVGAMITGALHMDGLADMADGFGGGRTREDVLRIMRDHAIGSYGAIALVLLILLKTAAISILIDRHRAGPFLLVAPSLGRWSTILLNNLLPYARRELAEGAPAGGAVSDFVGRMELLIGSAIVLALAIGIAGRKGIVSCVIVTLATVLNSYLCRRRIGGVTGDTLGANSEISELAVFLIAVASR